MQTSTHIHKVDVIMSEFLFSINDVKSIEKNNIASSYQIRRIGHFRQRVPSGDLKRDAREQKDKTHLELAGKVPKPDGMCRKDGGTDAKLQIKRK